MMLRQHHRAGRLLCRLRWTQPRGLKTRAAVCEELESGKVQYRDDWEVGEVSAKSVHIKAKCAGINFGEVLQLQGKYQEKLEPPFVPGNEMSGVVTAVGSEVSRVRPGDAVVALPRGGAWSGDVIVPEAAVFGLGRPADQVDFASAAALSVCYGTAHMALNERAAVRKGKTVVVTAAAGGVGLAAVQVGASLGARVVACASTKEKVDLAIANGAAAGVVYGSDPKQFRQDLKAHCPDGVDVALDMVGDPLFEPLVRSLNFAGRLVVVGFAGGAIPAVKANILLVKHAAVLGLYWGASAKHDPSLFARNTAAVNKLWLDGTYKPHVGAVYPLADANLAVAALLQRKTTGKVVLDLSSSS